MVYLAAIIDWYSKAVLSWRISNTMDTDLVMGVLNEALEKAITEEEYENAARLRDRIKQLEKESTSQ